MINVVVGVIPLLESDPYQYLLMNSTADFGRFTNFYYPPGGHVELDESEKNALIREIYEELGITINPINKITSTPGVISNQITHWYLCDPINIDTKISLQIEEVKSIKWLTKNQILSATDIWPATVKFFTDYI